MAIVLDTNVVRKAIAGDVDPSGLMAFRREGGRIHLADSCLAELTHQLLTGALPWTVWARGRPLLLELVDRDEPALLGGREGLHRAGLLSRHPCSDAEVASTLAHFRAGWTLLTRAQSRVELEQGEVGLPVQRLVVSLRAQQVIEEHGKHQDKWADGFESFREKFVARSPDVVEALPQRGDSQTDLEAYLEVIAAKVDEGRPLSTPTPSYRLDAYLRVDALLHLRALRRSERYDARKHANDSFDCELLKYLAFPEAVCTDDRRFIQKVKTSGTWQRKWIVQPHELEDPAVRALVSDLRWPTDAT